MNFKLQEPNEQLDENINKQVFELDEELDDFDLRWDNEFNKYIDTPLSTDEFHKLMKRMMEFE